MNLYIEGKQVYYAPSGNGNAVLIVDPDTGNLYALPEDAYGPTPTLSPNDATRTNMSFFGPGFARLRAPQGDFVLQGVIAQILPNGQQPVKGPFIPGMGHTGLELKDNPSITQYSANIPNAQIGVAASFVEAEAWTEI